MTVHHDLIVLGGGPAGVNAALVAASHGLDVRLVEENPLAGGQVFRAPPSTFSKHPTDTANSDHQAGEELRRRLDASSVNATFDHVVWNVTSGYRVDACGPEGVTTWTADTLVVAAGTSERVVPFSGWTLPGVIGLAAATILLKSQNVLPGQKTVVAGSGPLLAAVAYGIISGGGEVAALVDINHRGAWLRRAGSLARRPDLVSRGAGWLNSLRRSGTPILSAHTVSEVHTDADYLQVTVAPLDKSGRPKQTQQRKIHANAVAVGHGLTPATEVTRLLGAQHKFEPRMGGWVPVRDQDMRTSCPTLFAVGDGAGVTGAAAAELEGAIAGYTIARDRRLLDERKFNNATKSLRRRLRRAECFGAAMAELMELPATLVDAIPNETVVCRCEDVTRYEVDQAIADGACDINQLKAWTRCGMGPCQGRMCGEIAASLLARRVGDRDTIGTWTPRIPLRPLSVESAVGAFEYDDIALPGAAPL